MTVSDNFNKVLRQAARRRSFVVVGNRVTERDGQPVPEGDERDDEGTDARQRRPVDMDAEIRRALRGED